MTKIKTMRTFDAASLTPVRSFSGADIVALRRREQIDAPLFARYLNVTETLLAQWETGARVPRGAGAKLLTLIDKYGLKACV